MTKKSKKTITNESIHQQDDNSSAALKIEGYTVIQVTSSPDKASCHCMYLREHNSVVSLDEWPQERTLLVYNIPPYCTEKNVRLLLDGCGDISKVYLQDKPSSRPQERSPFLPSDAYAESHIQVAYVVFRESAGVKTALNLSYSMVRSLSSKAVPIVSGLKGYIQRYSESVCDVKALEQKAEKFMADYNAKKEEEIAKEKEMEGVPDEDGFIKVTRHGKNKGLRRTEETEKRGHEHKRERMKKHEMKDFYVFQYRERKRKHIAELQAKFEEDKKKINEMKRNRKFRPY